MYYESNNNSRLHATACTEWKYLDAQDSSGWKVISIFYPRIGNNPPTVSTYVNSPDGQELSDHQIGEADLREGSITINGQRLDTDLSGTILKLDNPIVKTDLAFLPVIRPHYVPVNQSGMLWQIEIPRAEVSGNLVQGATEISFFGRGYHDHNWFNLSCPDHGATNRELLPYYLHGWQFGRLFGDELTMVYGFSPKESHFLLWKGKNLIKTDHINRLSATSSLRSEKFGVSYPSQFDLAALNLSSQIELGNRLSEKKLSVTPDGFQTGYIRSVASISDSQLGHLEGIHETWL